MSDQTNLGGGATWGMYTGMGIKVNGSTIN